MNRIPALDAIKRSFYRDHRRDPSADEMAYHLSTVMRYRLKESSFFQYRNALAENKDLSSESLDELYHDAGKFELCVDEIESHSNNFTGSYLKQRACDRKYIFEYVDFLSRDVRQRVYYYRRADILLLTLMSGSRLKEITSKGFRVTVDGSGEVIYLSIASQAIDISLMLEALSLDQSKYPKGISNRVIPLSHVNKKEKDFIGPLIENLRTIEGIFQSKGKSFSRALRHAFYYQYQPNLDMRITFETARHTFALELTKSPIIAGFNALEKYILVRTLMGIRPVDNSMAQKIRRSKKYGSLDCLLPNKSKMLAIISKVYKQNFV